MVIIRYRSSGVNWIDSSRLWVPVPALERVAPFVVGFALAVCFFFAGPEFLDVLIPSISKSALSIVSAEYLAGSGAMSI